MNEQYVNYARGSDEQTARGNATQRPSHTKQGSAGTHTMNTGDMEFWEWASAKLRRVHRHSEMTPEEMEALLDTVEDEPLPENQIEAIVASMRAGLIPHQEPAPGD
mgnify:CR=1 FL=1